MSELEPAHDPAIDVLFGNGALGATVCAARLMNALQKRIARFIETHQSLHPKNILLKRMPCDNNVSLAYARGRRDQNFVIIFEDWLH